MQDSVRPAVGHGKGDGGAWDMTLSQGCVNNPYVGVCVRRGPVTSALGGFLPILPSFCPES